MKTVFVTNIFTPHQEPLSDVFFQKTEGEYQYLETASVDKKSLPIGWCCEKERSYIIPYEEISENEDKIEKMICDAEYVICGSAPDEYIKKRLKQKKVTFKYSERMYRPNYKAGYLKRRISAWLHHGRFQKYPLYMLCASAYTAADCAVRGNYINRTYKWGYFPKTKYYDDIEAVLEEKNCKSILWVARLLELKHPEFVVKAAKCLKKEGYSFELNLIGMGILEEELRKMIRAEGVEDVVHLLGSMPPEQVREYMEHAGIFLFTSDFNEGWGAVLNESMNSGCAVVASHAIGAVPFLLKHKENGLIYENGNFDDLYQKVKSLLDFPKEQKRLGKNAYVTITELWNEEVAAERFLRFAEEIKIQGQCDLFEDGPCSRAEIIEDGWFKE